jgi:hypothetical protein
MIKTKIILVILTLSLVILAVVGATYAQFANTQNGIYSQTPQGYTANYGYLPPNTASSYNGYTWYPQQGVYPNRSGMGMCMMGGRYW